MATPLLGLDSRKPHLRILLAYNPDWHDLETMAGRDLLVETGICLDLFPERIEPDRACRLDDAIMGLIVTAAGTALSGSFHTIEAVQIEGRAPYARISHGAAIGTQLHNRRSSEMKADLFITMSDSHVFIPGPGLMDIETLAPHRFHSRAMSPRSWLQNAHGLLVPPRVAKDRKQTGRSDFALALSIVSHILPETRGDVDLLQHFARFGAARLPHLLAGRRGQASHRVDALIGEVDSWLRAACESWGIHPDRPWAPQFLSMSAVLRQDLRALQSLHPFTRTAGRKIAKLLPEVDPDLACAVIRGFGSGDPEAEKDAMAGISAHDRIRLTKALTAFDDRLLACLPKEAVKTALHARWRRLSPDG